MGTRRALLGAVGLGILVTGFDPVRRSWATSEGDNVEPLPPLDGEVLLDAGSREAVSQDAGRYVVPAGGVTQPVYFRGGNSTKQMVSVVLVRDGVPMRYFPIAAKGATHVALRVVEDLLADTVLELHIAAPEGCSGTVILDLGLVEV